MEVTQATEQKPRRIRKKSTRKQLQQALDAAQALDSRPADDLTLARMKLVQSRLDVLNKMQARERINKIQKLKSELAAARAEIEKLTSELAAVQTDSQLLAEQTPNGRSFNIASRLKEVEQQFYQGQHANKL